VIEIFANAPFRESAIPLKLPRPAGEELFCRFGSSQELGAPAAVVFEHGFARSATVPAWWSPLQETISRWSEHKDARLGAALAYYSIFSVGPLIVIAIAIAGLVFGAEAVQAQVFGALHSLLGDSGTQAIDAMLKGANRPREGILATVIGVATLVFAAVGVVVQLKDALNTVWEVETPPGSGIWRFVRTYIWSLAGVVAWFSTLDLPAVDRGTFCRGEIRCPLSAGGLITDRRVPRVIRGDQSALRHDVQMASRYAHRMARCVARRNLDRGAV
jgi:Virulence factor BrkB